MLEKCVLAILELNWNQRLGRKKTKLNICHHMVTSSTQLQNRSFHVVERTRTSTNCQKMKNARAKILFFIDKHANLWDFCCRRRRGCLSSLILQISFKTTLVLKRSKRNQLPLPSSLFSGNFITHRIRNETKQWCMYTNYTLEKCQQKEKIL